MVTDASSGHDACRGQDLNGVNCDETAAAGHGHGCYYYCYSVGQFGVVSFSYFSCDDFGTKFSPIDAISFSIGRNVFFFSDTMVSTKRGK